MDIKGVATNNPVWARGRNVSVYHKETNPGPIPNTTYNPQFYGNHYNYKDHKDAGESLPAAQKYGGPFGQALAYGDQWTESNYCGQLNGDQKNTHRPINYAVGELGSVYEHRCVEVLVDIGKDVTSCSGHTCNTENDFCWEGSTGASDSSYICKSKEWVKASSKEKKTKACNVLIEGDQNIQVKCGSSPEYSSGGSTYTITARNQYNNTWERRDSGVYGNMYCGCRPMVTFCAVKPLEFTNAVLPKTWQDKNNAGTDYRYLSAIATTQGRSTPNKRALSLKMRWNGREWNTADHSAHLTQLMDRVVERALNKGRATQGYNIMDDIRDHSDVYVCGESTWKHTNSGPGGRTGKPVSSETSCAAVRQQVLEPLAACECQESWSYKINGVEKIHHGCTETADRPGEEWCYVSNPDECPISTSEMSTAVEGETDETAETRKWIACKISPFDNEFYTMTKYSCEASGACFIGKDYTKQERDDLFVTLDENKELRGDVTTTKEQCEDSDFTWAVPTTCEDDTKWVNPFGSGCAEYVSNGWCVDGRESPDSIRDGSVLGSFYSHPEDHCCACGKGRIGRVHNCVDQNDWRTLSFPWFPDDALSCSGWPCDMEGQFCPKGVEGAGSKSFLCKKNKIPSTRDIRPLEWVEVSARPGPPGENCEDYVTLGYCKNGEVQLGFEHFMGEGYNHPEENCCACGKPRPQELDVPHCFVPKDQEPKQLPMCVSRENKHSLTVGMHFGGTVCTVKKDTMESTCIQYRTGAGVLRNDDFSISTDATTDTGNYFNSAFDGGYFDWKYLNAESEDPIMTNSKVEPNRLLCGRKFYYSCDYTPYNERKQYVKEDGQWPENSNECFESDDCCYDPTKHADVRTPRYFARAEATCVNEITNPEAVYIFADNDPKHEGGLSYLTEDLWERAAHNVVELRECPEGYINCPDCHLKTSSMGIIHTKGSYANNEHMDVIWRMCQRDCGEEQIAHAATATGCSVVKNGETNEQKPEYLLGDNDYMWCGGAPPTSGAAQGGSLLEVNAATAPGAAATTPPPSAAIQSCQRSRKSRSNAGVGGHQLGAIGPIQVVLAQSITEAELLLAPCPAGFSHVATKSSIDSTLWAAKTTNGLLGYARLCHKDCSSSYMRYEHSEVVGKCIWKDRHRGLLVPSEGDNMHSDEIWHYWVQKVHSQNQYQLAETGTVMPLNGTDHEMFYCADPIGSNLDKVQDSAALLDAGKENPGTMWTKVCVVAFDDSAEASTDQFIEMMSSAASSPNTATTAPTTAAEQESICEAAIPNPGCPVGCNSKIMAVNYPVLTWCTGSSAPCNVEADLNQNPYCPVTCEAVQMMIYACTGTSDATGAACTVPDMQGKCPEGCRQEMKPSRGAEVPLQDGGVAERALCRLPGEGLPDLRNMQRSMKKTGGGGFAVVVSGESTIFGAQVGLDIEIDTRVDETVVFIAVSVDDGEQSTLQKLIPFLPRVTDMQFVYTSEEIREYKGMNYTQGFHLDAKLDFRQSKAFDELATMFPAVAANFRVYGSIGYSDLKMGCMLTKAGARLLSPVETGINGLSIREGGIVWHQDGDTGAWKFEFDSVVRLDIDSAFIEFAVRGMLDSDRDFELEGWTTAPWKINDNNGNEFLRVNNGKITLAKRSSAVHATIAGAIQLGSHDLRIQANYPLTEMAIYYNHKSNIDSGGQLPIADLMRLHGSTGSTETTGATDNAVSGSVMADLMIKDFRAVIKFQTEDRPYTEVEVRGSVIIYGFATDAYLHIQGENDIVAELQVRDVGSASVKKLTPGITLTRLSLVYISLPGKKYTTLFGPPVQYTKGLHFAGETDFSEAEYAPFLSSGSAFVTGTIEPFQLRVGFKDVTLFQGCVVDHGLLVIPPEDTTTVNGHTTGQRTLVFEADVSLEVTGFSGSLSCAGTYTTNAGKTWELSCHTTTPWIVEIGTKTLTANNVVFDISSDQGAITGSMTADASLGAHSVKINLSNMPFRAGETSVIDVTYERKEIEGQGNSATEGSLLESLVGGSSGDGLRKLQETFGGDFIVHSLVARTKTKWEADNIFLDTMKDKSKKQKEEASALLHLAQKYFPNKKNTASAACECPPQTELQANINKGRECKDLLKFVKLTETCKVECSAATAWSNAKCDSWMSAEETCWPTCPSKRNLQIQKSDKRLCQDEASFKELSAVCKFSCTRHTSGNWKSVKCESDYALQTMSENSDNIESIVATKPKKMYSGTVEIEAQVSAFGKVSTLNAQFEWVSNSDGTKQTSGIYVRVVLENVDPSTTSEPSTGFLSKIPVQLDYLKVDWTSDDNLALTTDSKSYHKHNGTYFKGVISLDGSGGLNDFATGLDLKGSLGFDGSLVKGELKGTIGILDPVSIYDGTLMITTLDLVYDTSKKITADAVIELKMPSMDAKSVTNQATKNLTTLVFSGQLHYEEGKTLHGRLDTGNSDLPMLTNLVRLSNIYVEVAQDLSATTSTTSTTPSFIVRATMHLGKQEQLTLTTTAEFPSSYGRNVLKAHANIVKLADLADEGQLSEQLLDIELRNCEIELDWDPENFANTYKLRVAGTSNFYGFEGRLEFTITRSEVTTIVTPSSAVATTTTTTSEAAVNSIEIRTEIMGTLSITKKEDLDNVLGEGLTYEYEGCYKDTSESQITIDHGTMESDNPVQECGLACAQEDDGSFFALRGHQCLCSKKNTAHKKYGKVSEDQCSDNPPDIVTAAASFLDVTAQHSARHQMDIVLPSITLYDPSYDSGMLSSSSNWANDAIGQSHGRGRLADATRSWSAWTGDQNQWWQINTPPGSLVTGAAVRGRPDGYHSQYVSKWKFQFWDGASWQWVDNGALFDGTPSAAAHNTQIDISFSAPITTTKVRFVPWVWNDWISARMALRITDTPHQDSTTLQRQDSIFPKCQHLIGLNNAENSNKPTYGEDMRACFSPDTFNVAPASKQWISQVGDYVATPSGDDRPYLSSDQKGTKGAKMNQPYVKGSSLAKLNFGGIKGPGTLSCFSSFKIC